MVEHWVVAAGLDPSAYGTHSMRRTKATLIYKRTKNLRAVQLLLGHSKLESTVRYLGIEVDDALRSPSRLRSEPGAAARQAPFAGEAAAYGDDAEGTIGHQLPVLLSTMQPS
ncbi:tyrosine-type recombinase/integrase [Thauera humireducens]|uniref:tyrosine-type recombinase/integrase n=1 Tax=Thauera humireducens TaxID=1134435 RepID=UPI00311E22B6